ncbi:hypothetical protein [Mycobacterium sp. M26]|uniref:hypothetical protein n=1 Tax=Mycobacterium sp. M26 TaxID=1762962 RepID=UPI0009EC48F1|nr:hypothetical protein [Mycobacterium sp. M26]
MSSSEVRRRGDRAVVGVVFLMLFAFSYSEQLVSALFPDSGGEQMGWRIAVVVVDVVVLGLVGLMKRTVTQADGDAPRLWGWWWTGVVVLIGIDLIRLLPVQSIRIDILSATLYAAAMGWTTAAAVNADPVTLVRTARRIALPRDWSRVRAIVPLVVGTWICYLAAAAFVDYFQAGAVRTLDPALAAEVAALPKPEQTTVLSALCEGAISPVFFQQVVGVLPVLLLTLGIEFNYFRRTLTDAGQRAATAATVTVMAAGLVGALSTLPWDGQGCGDILSSWHEYVAFVLSVQGVFTGLATLVWLLIASTPDAAASQSG